MAGSGLGVGICKEAHEKLMSHIGAYLGDFKGGWGRMCQGKILALCSQRGKSVYFVQMFL